MNYPKCENVHIAGSYVVLRVILDNLLCMMHLKNVIGILCTSKEYFLLH